MRKKKIFLIILILTLIGAVFIFLPGFIIGSNAKNKIFFINTIPEKEVAIVFGAAIYKNKLPSDVLADRIKIAKELYFKGKVKKILMTGGNPEFDHNEPQVMKDFAVKLGVPEDVIYLDYAGFRTYDSCARAAKVFMIEEAVLVTQNSHLPRALYLCDKFDIDSVGIAADLQTYRNWDKQMIREFAASVFAFWEVNLLKHDPKFLGEQIPLEK